MKPSVMRILDANANRAREAMRVMEEASRFVLNDAVLSEDIKRLRHDFARLTCGFSDAIFWRDTGGDVGTGISTAGEKRRRDILAVVIAAGKRLSEALRAIEEYAKIELGEVAGGAQALRYRGYEIEKKMVLALRRHRPVQWGLCVLISEGMCRRGYAEVLRGVVAGGADCVQVREKGMAGGLLLERVRETVAICKAGDVKVIVNDRPDVAVMGGADGVHLGQGDLPCDEVKGRFGDELMVGVSTSCLEQARMALEMGADYCGVGPMYPTETKAKKRVVGPSYLAAFLTWGKLPHLAIGGIDPDKARGLVGGGCLGLAVSGAICKSEDPEGVTREFVEILNAGKLDDG